MNFKKTLKPYLKKLQVESVLKSIITGTAVGLTAGIIAALIMRFFYKEHFYFLLLIIIAAFAVLFALLSYIFLFSPTIKNAAARTDMLGLDERVSTMLDYEKDDSYIADLQRKDTLLKLSDVSPKQLKLSLPKNTLLTNLFLAVLVAVLMIVPIGNSINAQASAISKEESQLIDELIAGLRQTVSEADVDDEVRATLEQIVDDLEASISDSDTTLEKTAKISAASQKINEIIANSQTKDEIGSALSEYEITSELGEAISEGDIDKVKQALENIRTKLSALEGSELIKALDELVESLDNAVKKSASSNDALTEALQAFSGSLSTASAEAAKGTDVSGDVDTAITVAENSIIAALEEQQNLEEAASTMQDLLKNATNELADNLKDSSGTTTTGTDADSGTPSESGTNADGSTPSESGTNADGSTPSESGTNADGSAPSESGTNTDGSTPSGSEDISGSGNTSGGGAGGGVSEQTTSKAENIFDPSEDSTGGTVPYDEVYEDYYSDAIQDIINSDLPDNVRKAIEDYYKSIK